MAPPTQRMVDRQGNLVEVPAAQAAEAYRSGQFSFAQGDTVVLQRGGQQVALSAEEAAAALSGGEGRFYSGGSSQLLEEQELQREYSGLAGQAKSFAAGAARGLTLGLSDVALSEIGGDDTRQELQRLQRYAGEAGMVGEAAGAIGGALASGGSGLVARGASLGVRTGAAVGSLAERAAVRGGLALGLAEGGAAARALGTAAAFGAEGALYGAGAEAGRQAIANEKYDGEKLVAAGLHGGLAGAALGGAGSLVASGARAVASKATGAGLDAAISLVERAGGKASTVAREGEALEEKIARLVDAVSPGGAEKFAAEKALKSTGGSQKQIGKILDASNGVQSRAQQMLEEEIPAALGRERGAIMSKVEMREAMPALLRQEGEKIGGSLRALDAAGAEGPSIKRIVDEARTTLLADLKANAFARKEASALEDAIGALREYEGGAMRFEGLHDLSSRLGATIRGKQGLEAEALGKFRGLIEAEIERAGDAAASKLGQSFGATYREAKQGYAAAKMLEKAVTTGAEREAANRSISLTDSIMLAAGLVQGGPVGFAVGAAQAYANNIARRYGDQAAAFVLREVGRGRPLTEAVGRVVDQVVDKSVQGLFVKAAKGAARLGEGTARAARLQATEQGKEALDRRAEEKEFDRRREALLAPSPTPPGGLPPEATASAQATAERARTFLQSKMPRAPGEGVGLQPHLSKLRPSAEAQRRFLEYARAAENPVSVLEDLARGKLPRAGLETLREVYPEMYASVQARAAELLTEQRGKLGAAEVQRIAAVLGVPAGPADAPEILAAVQAGYAAAGAKGAPGGGPPGQPPARPVNTSKAYDLDSVEKE